MGIRFVWTLLAVVTSLALGVLAQDGEDEGEAAEEEGEEGVIVETPLGYPPEPAEPWEGELDVTQEVEKCIQFNPSTQMADGTEDCLKLDVFTPKHPEDLKKNRLPVLVYIHGGGFHMGGTNLEENGPDFLMTKDLILVNIRYRISIFGFLSFEDNVLSGNAGMKDQVLALKWIRNNIASFGGDPTKVTIFGLSAGAASVHLHMLSPLSRGLFHKAITASGTAVSPYVTSRYPRLTADIMSDVYNCSRRGSEALLACLQAADAEELTLAQYNANPTEKSQFEAPVNFFTPCVEPKHEHAFLTEDPYEIMARGEFADVPFLTGTTQTEMGMLQSVLSLTMIPEKVRRKLLNDMAGDLDKAIPPRKPFVRAERMTDALKKFYFKNKPPSLRTLPGLVNMSTDVNFLIPACDTVTLHLRYKKSPVYQYLFTHDTDYSFARRTIFFAPPDGVNHGDLVNGYIFYAQANEVDPEDEAYTTVLRAVQMWADFVTYGNPTPDDSLGLHWLPAESGNRYYLNFGKELKLEKNVEEKRVQFWYELRKRENFTV